MLAFLYCNYLSDIGRIIGKAQVIKKDFFK